MDAGWRAVECERHIASSSAFRRPRPALPQPVVWTVPTLTTYTRRAPPLVRAPSGFGRGPRRSLARSLARAAQIDAVGSNRYDSSSGGTREIQRTMLELLNQLDGFDERGDVKVIMATNKIE